MAYEPLHLKYRPQRFADVVGQEAVTQTLANAIRLNRIAPAYLFCGPRGTGKTSSARILAKSLNCIQGPTADPCNGCSFCREITQGSCLDVIEIDAASNTGVDNIRELIERAQFAPVSSRYKVYVLDEVHMLSSAAFNALLKTLEEPPEHVIFVLATTDPQRVLPTVISRCQRFDYRRIPLRAMVDHLVDIAWKEGINITDAALELVAQLSQGGLRDAESLLDQLSLLDGEISVESVWELVGAVPERQLLSLIDAIQQQDPEQVLTQTRHLLDHGKEPLTLLQNLVSFYRDLLLAKTAPQRRDLVALTQPTWEALQQRGASYSNDRILAAQAHLQQAEPQIRQTHQPQLWLEIALLDLLPLLRGRGAPSSSPGTGSPSAPSASSTTSPPAGSVATPSSPQSLPTPIPSPPSHRADPVESLTVTAIDSQPTQPTPPATSLSQLWPHFLDRLKSPVIRALMDLGQVIEESSDQVTLGFPNQGFAEKAKSKISQIQPVIDELLGKRVSVQFGIKVGKPISPDPAPPPPIPPPASMEAYPAQPAPSPPERSAPSLPTPSPPPQSQSPLSRAVGEDELNRVSRRLAEFFNGVVVKDEEDLVASETQDTWTDPVGQVDAETDEIAPALGSTSTTLDDDELPF